METKKRSFALGYSYVVHSFISWMMMAFVFVCFAQLVFPDLMAKFGWDRTTLSLGATVGGIIGAVAGIFIGQWVQKKGPKIVIVIGMLLGGIDLVMFAYIKTLTGYFITMILAHILTQMYCQMTTNNLIANWFVKKKGAILGITTAGLPAASALLLPAYSAISGRYGMTAALWTIGALYFIMGIASIFWVKNTPFEVGLTPDNLPVTEQSNTKVALNVTLKQMLRKKETWFLIIIFGLMFMSTIVASSQKLVYMLQRDFTQGSAVAVISTTSFCGIIGSIVFGFIDQKWGTKAATIFYFIIAAACYLIQYFAAGFALIVVLSVIGGALGGAPGNLLPSYIISLFGAPRFAAIHKLVMPMVAVIRALGYTFAAWCAVTLGGGMAAGAYLGLGIVMVICLVLTLFLGNKPVELPEE